MNRISFIFLSFLMLNVNLPLSAQDYVPLLEEGKSWDSFNSAYNGEIGIVPYDSGQRISLEGDTTINGQKWQKVFFQAIVSESEESFFIEPFSLTTKAELSIFLREDIEDKKVYAFIPVEGELTEVVLYNFNVTVGDTLDLWNVDNGVFKKWPYYCDNISTLILDNGEEVNTYNFLNIEEPWVTDVGTVTIIEGIGSNHILYPALSTFDLDIKCVKTDSDILLSSPSCGFIINSIPGILPNKKILYPNPSNGKVQFSSSIDFDRLEVFNSIGQRIEKYDLYIIGGNQVIEFEEDLQGLYFVSFFKNGAIHTERLLLE